MKILLGFFCLLNLNITTGLMNDKSHTSADESLMVKKCADFILNGKGDNQQWALTNWISMSASDNDNSPYVTRFKILYSEKGIYVLGYCEDKLISTDYDVDQGDIWNGDVFEVFLQTDPVSPLYFEYEINPLNAELAILVPNHEGDFFGWSPWHYEGERKVKKEVYIDGGAPKSGEKINSWTAEIFFPFALFKALKNVPPRQGTEWKGNFYRMDYDNGKRNIWSWKPVKTSFHEYKKFGSLIFE